MEAEKNWTVSPTRVMTNGVWHYEIHCSPDGECAAEVVHLLEDAKLIAAAPKLLRALRKVHELAKQIGLEEDLDFEEFDYMAEAINEAIS